MSVQPRAFLSAAYGRELRKIEIVHLQAGLLLVP